MHDIILGAETDDYIEVDLAVAENAAAIVQREPTTGMTALHIAAGDGNLKMVRHLLAFPGVDLTIVDQFGRDPIDMATNIGNTEIVELLSRVLYPSCYEVDQSAAGPKLVP
ncbi:MAG: ankyrin repeat domain-containing protein [Acetobacteraceae bacterium]